MLPAANGKEALHLSQTHGDRIKLLITDVIMPGMNGSDLARKIKESHPQIGVLYMSGYSGDILAKRQTMEPNIAFIEKAHVPTNLVYRVRALLDAQGSTQTSSKN